MLKVNNKDTRTTLMADSNKFFSSQETQFENGFQHLKNGKVEQVLPDHFLNDIFFVIFHHFLKNLHNHFSNVI